MVNFPEWLGNLSSNHLRAERTYVQVKPGKTTLGRKAQNDIVIEDEVASRDHAVLEFDRTSNRLIIWDSGSTNGTFVNGKKIFKAHTLEHNDQLRIGAHLITVISTDTASLDKTRTNKLGNYNELLLHSLDNNTVLLLEFSKELSKIQNLGEAQENISEFLKRMLDADNCRVVLAENFDDLVGEFGSRKILDRLTQTQSPVIISNNSNTTSLKSDIASLVLSPVLIDQKLAALIYATKKDKAARPFEELDLLLIVGVSHHAAMTIQRLKVRAGPAAVRQLRHAHRASKPQTPAGEAVACDCPDETSQGLWFCFILHRCRRFQISQRQPGASAGG